MVSEAIKHNTTEIETKQIKHISHGNPADYLYGKEMCIIVLNVQLNLKSILADISMK